MEVSDDEEEGPATQELTSELEQPYKTPVLVNADWRDLVRDMRAETARPQLILTDPPYGVLEEAHDVLTYEDIRRFCVAMAPIIDPTGTMLIFIPHHRHHEWVTALEKPYKVKGKKGERLWTVRQAYVIKFHQVIINTVY